jgi:hypothetical protein
MKRPKNYNTRTQTISGWLADALQNRGKKKGVRKQNQNQ